MLPTRMSPLRSCLQVLRLFSSDKSPMLSHVAALRLFSPRALPKRYLVFEKSQVLSWQTKWHFWAERSFC